MNARPFSPRSADLRAFSLVEVMVAATVLVFGLVSVITVSQRGLQALDSARHLSQASQLLQSEMERLRLMSWAQLQALQEAGGPAPADALPAGLVITRDIRDIKTGMKEITVAARWRGYDGTEHSARLITRYGKLGLNDYFYTTH
jgi:type II secretory pathway pseudopilin PulG